MFGVCVHPRLGGWFAIRALLIFGGVTAGSEMVQPIPPDCVSSREGRIQLLEAFNYNWKVLSFNYTGQNLDTHKKHKFRRTQPSTERCADILSNITEWLIVF